MTLTMMKVKTFSRNQSPNYIHNESERKVISVNLVRLNINIDDDNKNIVMLIFKKARLPSFFSFALLVASSRIFLFFVKQ